MSTHKVIMIGLSGHFEYALPYMKKSGTVFSAIYTDSRENTRGGIARLIREGFAATASDIPFVNDTKSLFGVGADICIVNSIPGLNAGFAMEALRHGCSVFCEKPVATEAGQLEELMRVFRSSGRHLAAMFGTSFSPHVEAARRYLPSLGEVRLITAQKSYRLGNREPYYSDRTLYGGTIPWVMIHSFDWIETLTGLCPVPLEARASRRQNGGNGSMETVCSGIFTLPGGIQALCTADYLRPAAASTHDDDRMRICCTGGIMEISRGLVTVTDGYGEHILENASPPDIFADFILGCEGKEHRNTAKRAFMLTKCSLDARALADAHAEDGEAP